ncbi:LuxR C-terminal-related transcriptional regulator [uncultured Duncaniella sp.]|uniref:LuxR C-terminal-related transcriptional regulator n=1 Tax=uncultured Duncaniella sp. TaxID=2768039 RepID=UPI0026137FDA|nr:LuxR C-terminal-related transcriptional regulator [uncultured Duncaniella sp.]
MIDRHSSYRPENTMRELIRDNNLLLMTISRFDIAFGFGDSSVRETCEANGVDTDTFLSVCNLLSGREHEIYSVSLPSLMGYLKHAHSSFIDLSLPKIRHKIIEAINYSETNEVSFLLIKFFDDYVTEVREHLAHENDIVFRYVEGLIEGKMDESFEISQFSVDHDHMGNQLNELKDIFIYHYSQRGNALLSSVLFDIINLEKDLMSHFEVENHLFVPAVIKLENKLRLSGKHVSEEEEAMNRRVETLGEREKEIICCVAKGMSNKEIADALCLSVHTVATHRKNISAKLEIHSTAGLAIFAILHKLVDIKDLNPYANRT